jgi:DNA-binding response OmpR family regulator
MRILLISNDQELNQQAQIAYEKTDELVIIEDWREAIQLAKPTDLMIVDIMSTLDEPHKISGYEAFAHAKMKHKVARGVPLVAIQPADDYHLDAMVGWEGFLHGLVKRPVTWKIFRRISTWV